MNAAIPRLSDGMLETSTISTREVRAFNGSKQKTTTSCTTELCMNKYKQQVTLMVIDMSFDVILGQDWLRKHRANLHLDGLDAAHFFHLGFMHTVPANPDIHIHWDSQPSGPIINAASFEHEHKQDQSSTFMVFVRSDPDHSSDPMINASTSQAPAQAPGVIAEHQSQVEKLLAYYPDVLCTTQPEGLPPDRLDVHTIPLIN